MEPLERWLSIELLGNSLGRWALAVGLAIATWVLLAVVRRIVIRRLHKLAAQTTNQIDDAVIEVLNHTKVFFYLVLSGYAGLKAVKIPEQVEDWSGKAAILVLVLQAGIWSSVAIKAGLRAWAHAKGDDSDEHRTVGSGIRFVGNLIIWSVAVLLILSNLGIEVGALLAGLGVGGIAVALALQNILGDLFASLSIFLDRPFDIGDFVIVGTIMGNVEKVGLRSTRIRSLSGEQLIVPNTDITSSRIQNYKRMEERRIVFSVGITYGTPHDKVAKATEIIRNAVESQPDVRFDRSHFKSYGDSALLFETVYYVLSPEFAVYMDRQQAINLELYRRFEEEGLSFAFPTQTLHLHHESPVTVAHPKE
ncbi:MAG: mechanosensitive ion channel family protein [Myxococcales bacterium]|nr:mechanosensitive ion channel family protein [Myxococcales bacterium]